jgi:hypothetical protein
MTTGMMTTCLTALVRSPCVDFFWLIQNSLDDNTKTSSDLMSEWFGAKAKGEWFPYPDKAVRFSVDLIANSCLSINI